MDEIYNEYSRIVYNYLFSLTNNSYLSEELMQETFYIAIKKINSFREECSMKVWLCEIAKNKWKDYLRKYKKQKLIPIDEVIEELPVSDSFENEIIYKEEMHDFYDKIYNLDSKAKKVIYLRIHLELSFKEIGELLDKSEQWARTIYYRGKLKLKEDYLNGKK